MLRKRLSASKNAPATGAGRERLVITTTLSPPHRPSHSRHCRNARRLVYYRHGKKHLDGRVRAGGSLRACCRLRPGVHAHARAAGESRRLGGRRTRRGPEVVRRTPVRRDADRASRRRGDRRAVGHVRERHNPDRHPRVAAGGRVEGASRAGVHLRRPLGREGEGAAVHEGNLRGHPHQQHHRARLRLRDVELQRRVPQRGALLEEPRRLGVRHRGLPRDGRQV